uniref:ADAMTS-like protein 1-like n=1 Tax=Saccoglossus kowalevskii TaxID=10224 RepID=A0ABM0MV13_SACKO|nr:PREDICTED: ADAMTS-like protein 1-like [Saccoglossus kowalevskii]
MASTDNADVDSGLKSLICIGHALAWSPWSAWSECSRTCGGGASYSLRDCDRDRDRHEDCAGKSIRYRTCSTQACCSGSADFRAQQCSAFNDVQFGDVSFEWIPKIGKMRQPCALICQAVGYDNIVEELAPKVLDGTPCYRNGRDMCINGECLPVGCDYELNSTAVEDECGVCNGDGSTCKQIKGTKKLSAVIARGIEELMILPVGSRNIKFTHRGRAHMGVRGQKTRKGLNQNMRYLTKAGKYEIEENSVDFFLTRSGKEIISLTGPTKANLSMTVLYTEASSKHEKVHYQYHVPRLFLWQDLGWTQCSHTCGGGEQVAKVKCVDVRTGEEVDESECQPNHKPLLQQRGCNQQHCPPSWVSDPWNPCTKSCGGGMQFRNVLCVEMTPSGLLVRVEDTMCSGARPALQRVCNMEPCPMWYTEPWSQCSATCGRGIIYRRVYCKNHDGVIAHGCTSNTKPSEEKHCLASELCVKEQEAGVIRISGPTVIKQSQSIQELSQASSEPSYVVGEWSLCSKTCGPGIQVRPVSCQVYLTYSESTVVLDDDQCLTIKPEENQECNIGSCMNYGESEYPTVDIETEIYKDISTSNSVENSVSVYVWQYNGYTDCSRSCLGGIQDTIIECYDMVKDEVVSDTFCNFDEQLPTVQHPCNNIPCPPEIRASICMKPTTTGSMEETDSIECNKLEQPPIILPCTGPPCYEPPKWKKSPTILGEYSKFVQKHMVNKLYFTIGGEASVFQEVTVIIKCPVKFWRRALIRWQRNFENIDKRNRKMTILKDGRLRISHVELSDAAVYSCVARDVSQNFTLTVQDVPVLETVSNSSVVRWGVGRWSACSESCGGGYQIRRIYCEGLFQDINSWSEIRAVLCESQPVPIDQQECNTQECPHWETGEWSDCNTRCISENTATHRRTVKCLDHNGKQIANKKCNTKLKPKHKEHCQTTNCKAIWHPSAWTQCSSSCGTTGTKTRMIGCVYRNRKQPADVQYCNQKRKPELVTACNRKPCAQGFKAVGFE